MRERRKFLGVQAPHPGLLNHIVADPTLQVGAPHNLRPGRVRSLCIKRIGGCSGPSSGGAAGQR